MAPMLQHHDCRQIDAQTVFRRPQSRYHPRCLEPVSYTHLDVYKRQIQRWTRHGQLQPPTSPLSSQTGMCAGGRTWYTRDVAMDGKAVYSMDFGQIQRRPDHCLPEWGAWPQLDESPEEPFLLSACLLYTSRCV